MIKRIIAIAAILASISGCMGPPELPKYEDIQPNESAYVIPLEGASKANQGKFDSASFLEEQKVAAKRIYLPLKKISTGRGWGNFKWIPTVRVITVDRSPITFVWEGNKGKSQGIDVESRDSIGFSVGINISAYILEEDTSTFLYHYPSGNLNKVLNAIVKSKATEILSREFAKYDLEGSAATKDAKAVEGARQRKGEIVDIAKNELSEFFLKSGVTISTFGLIGGLAYDDQEIQSAINNNFKSELDIKDKLNERLMQREVNQKNIDIATAEKQAAFEFAKAAQAREKQVSLEIARMNAQANLNRSQLWNGALPTDMLMMPAGSDPGFIFDRSK